MTVRDIRTAASLVGRRNALRYLAMGVGASLLAACTGKEKPAAQAPAQAPAAGAAGQNPAPSAPVPAPSGSASAAPSATTPAPAKKGVLDRSFDAFIRGGWTVQSTTPGGDVARGKATVNAPDGGNGGWTIEWDGGAGAWNGGFLLRGGRLLIQVFEGPKGLDGRKGAASAHSVPATVGDGFDLTLPWQPPETRGTGDGQRLSVTYAKNTLTIRHIEPSGSTTTHVCTRA
ncbi:hypothetical protein [Streptomyces sp. NPDC051211]|uniref:hypothetical protein n=1 Tax=Streptomyces sp. NPDC051211 TaxID=3154643 RepID=UPI00344D9D4B